MCGFYDSMHGFGLQPEKITKISPRNRSNACESALVYSSNYLGIGQLWGQLSGHSNYELPSS